MIEFQTPQISAEKVQDNRGTFTIEPLDRGFGYTFGNSLRRVLLSSLAGAAVTSVRIEGVAHEFSTINGVKEDVTDIVLNLKEIVCRMHSDAAEIEAPLVQHGRDALVELGLQVPERQVLELPFELPDPEAVGERGVNVERLLRDVGLALRREMTERPHVVRAVGELHEDHADVARHREEHLAEVLRLLLLA